MSQVASRGRRRILVVEDEAAVRRMVSEHLRHKGYEVSEAGDAESVLLKISREREPFDLVLTDIHLPGLSGVELLRILVSHSPLRPVLVITGDPDESLARAALRAGASGYLLKPFELFELDGAVRQALARLELVEAAEELARADAAELPDRGALGGVLPSAWLELADARSSAGAGHGYRVSRIAAAVASAMPESLSTESRRSLSLAARGHELGRLLGPASTHGELATRTSQLLYDLGVDSGVLRIVNNFRERWDGSGGPNGLAGEDIPASSLVLGLADSVDHEAAERLESGSGPVEAVAEAIGQVGADAPRLFGADLAEALGSARSVIEAIWVLARGQDQQSERRRPNAEFAVAGPEESPVSADSELGMAPI